MMELSGTSWTVNEEAVDTAELADGAVTLVKQANVATASIIGRATTGTGVQEVLTPAQARSVLSVRSVFIGETIRGQFTALPALCLWPNGQNVSRSTYSLLFDAITLVAPVSSTTNASTTVAINFNGLTGLAEQVQVGMPIEGPGIQAGTTIAAISAVNPTFLTATLSLAATATGSPVTLRIFPSGNGNGSTTFGVADYRDRAAVARGNMGGTAAGRLTSGVSGLNSSRLGVGGGDQNTPQQNLSESRGTSNNAGLNWVGQVPGDFLAGNTNDAGSIAVGSGTAGNVQPSIIENVAIYAGA
jgi:hypothetical protein